jgi:simple sugar transport system substrate-binding protein
MNGKLTALAGLTLIAALLFTACAPAATPALATEAPAAASTQPPAPPTAAPEKVKIGFVFLEGIDSIGWSQAANAGRLAVEKAFPNVETVYADNVPVSEDATRTLEQLIDDGCTMIFVTSSLADFTTKVATSHPDVKFSAFGLGEMLPNLRYYIMDIWSPGYLIGMVGGLLTKTNELGYLQGFPGYYSDVNAFVLGALSVNPDVTAKVVFVGSYADPVAERQLANALIDDGVDFLYGMTLSINFMTVAEERGVSGASLYVNEHDAAPNAYTTAMLLHMAPYFTEQVGKFLDGSWEGNTFDIVPYGNMTLLGPWGDNVPQGVRDRVDSASQTILAGTSPFVGPVYDAQGTLRVPEGQPWTFQDMMFGEPWPIQGLIVGK